MHVAPSCLSLQLLLRDRRCSWCLRMPARSRLEKCDASATAIVHRQQPVDGGYSLTLPAMVAHRECPPVVATGEGARMPRKLAFRAMVHESCQTWWYTARYWYLEHLRHVHAWSKPHKCNDTTQQSVRRRFRTALVRSRRLPRLNMITSPFQTYACSLIRTETPGRVTNDRKTTCYRQNRIFVGQLIQNNYNIRKQTLT